MNKVQEAVKKYRIKTLFFLLVVGLLAWMVTTPKKQYEVKNSKANLVLSLEVSVDVVNEAEKQAVHVYTGDKSFEWDDKNKYHRHCIGEMTPETFKSTCEVVDGKVNVIHYIGPVKKSSEFLCMYVNLDRKDCRFGNATEMYYTEEEIFGTK